MMVWYDSTRFFTPKSAISSGGTIPEMKHTSCSVHLIKIVSLQGLCLVPVMVRSWLEEGVTVVVEVVVFLFVVGGLFFGGW